MRWCHCTKVLLQEENARSEVSVVVLVRNTPAERAKLASLLHSGVQEAQGEEQLAPLRRARVYALQSVLVHDDRVRPQDAGLESRGGLVGHLGGHLE